MAIRKTKSLIEGELRMIRCVVDMDEELDFSAIHREFPTIATERGAGVGRLEPFDVAMDDFAWRGAFDFLGFDEHVESARPLRRLVIRGADATGVAMEALSRYQRRVGRRNTASATGLFSAALVQLESLWEPGLEEHRLDLEHALDTWQWMLRLEPEVGLAPQIAALFHDAARHRTDDQERLEHRVHRGVGDALARLGGTLARELVEQIGLTERDAERVEALVVGAAEGDADAALLDDAEALSFLSLMSARYADHFGLAQTRRKVAFMRGRLSANAQLKLGLFRIRPDVARLL
jgi:hypothetical protein